MLSIFFKLLFHSFFPNKVNYFLLEWFNTDKNNQIYVFKKYNFIPLTISKNKLSLKSMLELILDELDNTYFNYIKNKYVNILITIIEIDLLTYKYTLLAEPLLLKYDVNQPLSLDTLFNKIKWIPGSLDTKGKLVLVINIKYIKDPLSNTFYKII
jgi:hypothetical protein